jgi:two-component system cell cycle sensor histidine kinase/response regulator CckA
MNATRVDRSAEEELRDRYLALVEQAPDAILIHDGERIVMANAAATRLAGAERESALVGRPIDDFLNPPFLRAFEAQLVGGKELVQPAEPVRDTFRRLDGVGVPVDVTAIPFMDGGRLAAHVVIRDVSARLAAEAARAAALRAEEQQAAMLRAESGKAAAVRTLAGGVAHEVNNMMLIVLGYTEFLVRDPDLPEARRADALEIQRAADRTAAVARQLLTFSRRAAQNPQAIALDAILLDVRPMVERLLGDGPSLATELASPEPVWVDPHLVWQMLTNLVLNARDAMAADGTLTLSTRTVALDRDALVGAGGQAIPAGRYGVLTVADTGTGMDPDTLARIFEPFYSRKPTGKGSGLGLSVLSGIMDQSGGFVTVASTPEVGTTFSLYFRLHAEPAADDHPPEPPRVSDRALAGATILVVDDEPGARAIIARTLEGSGCTVLQAANGVAALELVDRHGPPDMVLTDLSMPAMGGAELAGHLSARWPRLPILFMSGYAQEHLRRAGTIDGTQQVIEKPFRSEALIQCVDAALRGNALRI